ncbi:3-hydroxyacyl-CoA dehydrogenase [Diaphorobacter sp. HDW4B]|uniref:3-hydroxyacyl-CoA dehydrogenase NAD-binding domain-containing protein n=1 Tax=Diaphorobacter sp. HDW4B TaxID=2714925 RepID=UPI00140A600A|nr:3-hydroxyacyl-CoA dehydrogenase NAD-binding domain-containing protein [Diaphorobacter sp. HDW4B]QIL71086.1 3-hydroxyacyl-CoA dehydrogenase [Diaphorobacter sp. HDW4B]
MSTPLFDRHGRVAVITWSNPPVNGISFALRQHVSAGLDAALADADIDAIVLTGDGRMFSGGADIREFNTPKSTSEPTTPQLISRIENLSKPVIAAIHGSALGGGLEMALGCHWRVALSDANVALPEVKLGLLPGGGGTQRLPRLIGVEKALDWIVTGKTVKAKAALEAGVLDAVFESDLIANAVKFAGQLGTNTALRATGKMPVNAPANAAELFEKARENARKTARGMEAPLQCIACVEASTRSSLEDGLTFERARFMELVNGTQSKAIRHLFFAEREAAKPPRDAQDAPLRNVQRVGVIGAGTMGGGIAMAFANAGYSVTLVEVTDANLQKGLGTIQRNYEATVSKGKLAAVDMQTRVERIRGTTDMRQLADVDLVIEAAFEDMTVKHDLFTQLDQICKPGAILATNTSRLDINSIAAVTQRPQDVVGLHFFSPANVMKLLEIVRADKTAPDVLATVLTVAKRIGKIPAVVGVCDGFVGNRMVSPYTREAHFLLEEGATPQQVDQALERFGLAMGPLRMGDMAGLDISWAARKRLAPTRPKHIRYCHIADRLCESGRLGQKTGEGFYRYEAGSRAPIPDPKVEDIIKACAAESGITRRAITDEEVVERTMYALVNEAARILEDGIAQRGSDIDVIYVNGYGFPAGRGGPLFYADTVGLPKVLERIREFHKAHGELWTPAPLFEKLVAEGKPISSYEVPTKQA